VRRIVVARELAAVQQRAEIRRAVHLAGEGAQPVNALVEGQRRAVQRLQAQAAGDVGDLAQPLGVVSLQRADRAHHRRAVGQGQPLLGRQRDRLESGAGQRLATGQDRALVFGLALADQGQTHVCQRGEIAARAERSLLRDDRMHARVQHPDQQIERAGPDAGIATGERVGPHQHDRPHGGRIERIAHADRVALDDVALEQLDLLARDHPVLERAEAGRDAVHDAPLVQQVGDGVRRPRDPGPRRVADDHARIAGRATRDSDDLLDGQTVSVKHNGVHEQSVL